MKQLRIAFVVAAMLLFAMLNTPALAAETHKAKLVGFNEVPSVVTGATGTFEMTVSPTEDSLDFALSYSGLENGTTTQAHIHVGQPNVVGAFVIFLCTNLTPPAGVPVPPACPVTSTTTPVIGTRTAADVVAQASQGVSAGEFSAVLRAIRSGKAYANVHTTISRDGEIRGQIK